MFFILSPDIFAQQTKEFKSEAWDYSVKYPANYQLKQLGKVVVFVAPSPDKKFDFAENVNIAAEVLQPPVPGLEEFFKNAKAKLSADPGVKILEEKKDKLAGVDSYKIVYSSKQKKAGFKLLQVIAIRKSRVYVVTYTALTEQYDRGLSQANSILRSFKFTD